MIRWEDIQDRINRLWIPNKAPHHSIIAQTGGGKSFLARHGIMQTIPHEQVLIIDVKGDDDTLEGMGEPCSRLPSRFFRQMNIWLSGEKNEEHWYRLVVKEDWKAARDQVQKALKRAKSEGNWTIYIDETRALTDPAEPSLRLRPQIEDLWLRGRSRRNCVVAATQGPRWVPRSFYDQAQFHWIGRIEDSDSQMRLREIGGLERWHLQQIKELKTHHWVYTDGQDDYRFRGITKVTI